MAVGVGQAEEVTRLPHAIERDSAKASCPVCGDRIRLRGGKIDRASGDRFTYTRCVGCRFLFVNPRPTRAALAEWYRRGDSPRGVGTWHAFRDDPIAMEEAAVDPRRLIPWGTRHVTSGGRRVLDLGAGLGLFAREALARGMAVTALELDRHAADELERELQIPVLRLPFEEFVPDGGFDLIIMNQVLEHAHDPVDWARKLRAALTPGGVVVVGLPHAGSFWQRSIGMADPYLKPPLHLNHFTRRSLTLLLSRAGLRVVASRTYSRLPWNLLSRKARLPATVRPVVDRLFKGGQRLPLALLDRFGLGIMLEVCARREGSMRLASEGARSSAARGAG
ncbi:MAG TPA: class I SAM-dependent methyltransferase [Candidatus Binatus sp.]|nr:class I SAM-dependent methyltransferase [Candidatus Binatus sp.]